MPCLRKIILIALFIPLKVFSRENTLSNESGIVLSSVANVPIVGATVIIQPGNRATVTDEYGKFPLKNSLASDSIFISAIGFESKVISYQEFQEHHNIISLSQRNLELSAIVISANRRDVLDHIGKLDIQMRSLTSSQEVLRLVPGLFIGQHAGGGKAEQFFLRGFDLDHGTDINISVDGMPVNMVSHAHGQGYADLHFLIPELIDNVNFRKGCYYPEKGNLNTAGFVEFKTKNVLPVNSVKVEAGQFNSYRGVAMLQLLKKETESAYVASEYMYTDGYFQNPQRFHRLSVFGKYNKKIKNTDLSFSASTFSSKWNASGQIPERAVQSGLIGFFGAVDPNEGGNTDRTNVNLQLQAKLGDGSCLRNQLYYTNYDFELYSDFTFFLKDTVNGDQIRQKEHRNLFGYNGSFLLNSDGKFSTEVGVNLRLDKTYNSELSRTKDRTIVTDPIKFGDIDELNAGVWVSETADINKRLSCHAGMRYDQFNNFYRDKLTQVSKNPSSGIISPKLSLDYEINNNTKVYLLAGKGFHSNDTRMSTEPDGRRILTAAYGADLGITSKPAKNILLQPTFWYLKLDQEFVYVGDEGIVEPSGSSRRVGLDILVRYQPIKSLFVDFDANFAHGRSMDKKPGENYLPLAPIFTSTGGITYKNTLGWNASLRYRYMGDRPANETNSVVARGYFVTDMVFNYTRSKFEVGASIQNLFDVRWKETQFETESRLKNEPMPVTEIHFTPGTPFCLKTHVALFF